MEHQNERAADTEHIKRCSHAVEQVCGKNVEIPVPLMNSCLGLLRINAMGVGSGRGRALFPVFSFLSHSCTNNCRHVSEYDADSGRFKVRLYSQVSFNSMGYIEDDLMENDLKSFLSACACAMLIYGSLLTLIFPDVATYFCIRSSTDAEGDSDHLEFHKINKI